MIHAPPGASRNFILSMFELALGSEKNYPVSVNSAVHCEKHYELDVRDLLPSQKWNWNDAVCQTIRNRVDSTNAEHIIISTHMDANNVRNILPWFGDFVHVYVYPKDMDEARLIFLNSFYKFVRGIFKIEMEENVPLEKTHWYTNFYIHVRDIVPEDTTPLNITRDTFNIISDIWSVNLFDRFTEVKEVHSLTYQYAVDNVIDIIENILVVPISETAMQRMIDMNNVYLSKHKNPVTWVNNI